MAPAQNLHQQQQQLQQEHRPKNNKLLPPQPFPCEKKKNFPLSPPPVPASSSTSISSPAPSSAEAVVQQPPQMPEEGLVYRPKRRRPAPPPSPPTTTASVPSFLVSSAQQNNSNNNDDPYYQPKNQQKRHRFLLGGFNRFRGVTRFVDNINKDFNGKQSGAGHPVHHPPHGGRLYKSSLALNNDDTEKQSGGLRMVASSALKNAPRIANAFRSFLTASSGRIGGLAASVAGAVGGGGNSVDKSGGAAVDAGDELVYYSTALSHQQVQNVLTISSDKTLEVRRRAGANPHHLLHGHHQFRTPSGSMEKEQKSLLYDGVNLVPLSMGGGAQDGIGKWRGPPMPGSSLVEARALNMSVPCFPTLYREANISWRGCNSSIDEEESLEDDYDDDELRPHKSSSESEEEEESEDETGIIEHRKRMAEEDQRSDYCNNRNSVCVVPIDHQHQKKHQSPPITDVPSAAKHQHNQLFAPHRVLCNDSNNTAGAKHNGNKSNATVSDNNNGRQALPLQQPQQQQQQFRYRVRATAAVAAVHRQQNDPDERGRQNQRGHCFKGGQNINQKSSQNKVRGRHPEEDDDDDDDVPPPAPTPSTTTGAAAVIVAQFQRQPQKHQQQQFYHFQQGQFPLVSSSSSALAAAVAANSRTPSYQHLPLLYNQQKQHNLYNRQQHQQNHHQRLASFERTGVVDSNNSNGGEAERRRRVEEEPSTTNKTTLVVVVGDDQKSDNNNNSIPSSSTSSSSITSLSKRSITASAERQHHQQRGVNNNSNKLGKQQVQKRNTKTTKATTQNAAQHQNLDQESGTAAPKEDITAVVEDEDADPEDTDYGEEYGGGVGGTGGSPTDSGYRSRHQTPRIHRARGAAAAASGAAAYSPYRPPQQHFNPAALDRGAIPLTTAASCIDIPSVVVQQQSSAFGGRHSPPMLLTSSAMLMSPRGARQQSLASHPVAIYDHLPGAQQQMKSKREREQQNNFHQLENGSSSQLLPAAADRHPVQEHEQEEDAFFFLKKAAAYNRPVQYNNNGKRYPVAPDQSSSSYSGQQQQHNYPPPEQQQQQSGAVKAFHYPPHPTPPVMMYRSPGLLLGGGPAGSSNRNRLFAGAPNPLQKAPSAASVSHFDLRSVGARGGQGVVGGGVSGVQRMPSFGGGSGQSAQERPLQTPPHSHLSPRGLLQQPPAPYQKETPSTQHQLPKTQTPTQTTLYESLGAGQRRVLDDALRSVLTQGDAEAALRLRREFGTPWRALGDWVRALELILTQHNNGGDGVGIGRAAPASSEAVLVKQLRALLDDFYADEQRFLGELNTDRALARRLSQLCQQSGFAAAALMLPDFSSPNKRCAINANQLNKK